MGWGSSNQGGLERFAPVEPDVAFKALQAAAKKRFTLKTTDPLLRTVTFSSGASLMTWGENFSAQVVPAEGGSTVTVQGVGKVGRQVQQNSRIAKLLDQLFTDFGAELRAQQRP